jgi:hypothetical protein
MQMQKNKYELLVELEAPVVPQIGESDATVDSTLSTFYHDVGTAIHIYTHVE